MYAFYSDNRRAQNKISIVMQSNTFIKDKRLNAGSVAISMDTVSTTKFKYILVHIMFKIII